MHLIQLLENYLPNKVREIKSKTRSAKINKQIGKMKEKKQLFI